MLKPLPSPLSSFLILIYDFPWYTSIEIYSSLLVTIQFMFLVFKYDREEGDVLDVIGQDDG
jgi:hypothetical protein